MNPYLWTAIHGNDPYPRFYHPSQLLWAEDRLEFSGKRGSTTARQALLVINLAKQEMYWFEPYPVGFVDISRVDLIDIDEVGIFLETVERKIGKLSIRNQVREEGPYNQSIKYTLMMAISGNMNGERLDFFLSRISFYSYYNGLLSYTSYFICSICVTYINQTDSLAVI